MLHNDRNVYGGARLDRDFWLRGDGNIDQIVLQPEGSIKSPRTTQTDGVYLIALRGWLFCRRPGRRPRGCGNLRKDIVRGGAREVRFSKNERHGLGPPG